MQNAYVLISLLHYAFGCQEHLRSCVILSSLVYTHKTHSRISLTSVTTAYFVHLRFIFYSLGIYCWRNIEYALAFKIFIYYQSGCWPFTATAETIKPVPIYALEPEQAKQSCTHLTHSCC